jgi:hypothetical protein
MPINKTLNMKSNSTNNTIQFNPVQLIPNFDLCYTVNYCTFVASKHKTTKQNLHQLTIKTKQPRCNTNIQHTNEYKE